MPWKVRQTSTITATLMNAPADELKAHHDRLRALVLSDILRAELKGTLVHWARYCANYPRRVKTLEQALYERNICQLGENCALTFNGLVLMKNTYGQVAIGGCPACVQGSAQALQGPPIQADRAPQAARA
jgi:hypothetical protein